MDITAHSARGPRLGIFWFCGVGRKQSRLVSISRPWCGISTVMDQRQLPLSHEEGWLHVQSLCPQLSATPFDHFPRGRLVWHGTSDQWRLAVHQKLMRGALTGEIL